MAQSPTRITADDMRFRIVTEDGGFKLGIAMDGVSHDSLLVFGSEWIQPGTEAESWEPDDETYEAYYVHTGALKVSWTGPDSGDSTVGPGEFFYFAPAHRYTIENVSDDEVFIVYGITPVMPDGG